MGATDGVNQIDITTAPPRPAEGILFLGTNTGPGRDTITADSCCLYRNGKPWLGAMGEIHYSRVTPERWLESLQKMKAGGLTVIASYVFWIHHEEQEGQFDWTGCRNLRGFAQACQQADIPLVVRLGPWCHGEVRNGGLPDWILNKGFEPRSNDPAYLRYARRLYEEIAAQLKGLLWKDGGPVIGVQIENEYAGPGEHLMELYRIAREVGIDVPIYTRTGWPSPATPVEFGKIFPLYGAYAEGFWDRALDFMPGTYWKAFAFETMRTDVQIGFDQLGEREEKDDADTPQYPYLTCELGGGMEMSYHRRVLIQPYDIYAVALTKLGSGSNLPGYYMYHGGTNPTGKLTTLHETQATRYWNDVPEISYDFQAPLGQFGQVREHFHLLRRLHLFLNDFGPRLARMRPYLPSRRPREKSDIHTLRWSVRTDGQSGFLFINNYQRGTHMPAKSAVTLEVKLAEKTVRFDDLAIPADTSLILPFNLTLSPEVTLHQATAQPLCCVGNACFFFQIPGLRSDFHVNGQWYRDVSPSLHPFATVHGKEFYLLDNATSLRAYVINQQLILSDGLIVSTETGPQLETTALTPNDVHTYQDGHWSSKQLNSPLQPPPTIQARKLRNPIGSRAVPIGSQKVAEAPSEEAYQQGALWTIDLPPLPPHTLLRVHYLGDVARAYANGRCINDSFFCGRPFDIEVTAEIREVEIRVLPWVDDAPIYVDGSIRSQLHHGIAEITRIELITSATIPLAL